MRAVLCHRWGEPEELTVEEIAPPRAGPGEVAVAVAAAGVNFADTLIVAGKYQEKPPFPFSPGMEIAGTVTAVGEGVSRVVAGDRVMALPRGGGFVESVTAAETDVFKIPDGMDFATAAGFPITYGTAHGALVWRAGLRRGEDLLVHGAAGGVGLAAVEVGKAMGARVIATAGGAAKLAVAEAHGADGLIDHKTRDIRETVQGMTAGRGVDVVFDPVGGEVFEASLRCVAWGARLVVIGFAGGTVPRIPANILLIKNLTATGLYWGSYRQHAPALLESQFADLFGWFEAGRLKPHVSHRLDLADAAQALRLLIDRQSTGKVVLTTGPG